jgi:hypothetical protein
MFISAKSGDITKAPTILEDVKYVVSYDKVGGSPLFVVMEHGNAVLLSVAGDKEFDSILNELGVRRK